MSGRMNDRPDRCDRCKWWEYCDNDGFCHRFPPVVVAEETDMVQFGGKGDLPYWHHPITRPEDFCGEFTPKEN